MQSIYHKVVIVINVTQVYDFLIILNDGSTVLLKSKLIQLGRNYSSI